MKSSPLDLLLLLLLQLLTAQLLLLANAAAGSGSAAAPAKYFCYLQILLRNKRSRGQRRPFHHQVHLSSSLNGSNLRRRKWSHRDLANDPQITLVSLQSTCKNTKTTSRCNQSKSWQQETARFLQVHMIQRKLQEINDQHENQKDADAARNIIHCYLLIIVICLLYCLRCVKTTNTAAGASCEALCAKWNNIVCYVWRHIVCVFLQEQIIRACFLHKQIS